FIALLGGAAVLSLLLTRFWRGFLVIGGLFLSLPFVLMLLLSIGRSVEERRNDQFTADVHSGRYNFGEHPELLAVAEAIAKNDSNAIRASAKNVRDLNGAGRDGMTLLFFAVNESLERPELASAVETLLAVALTRTITTTVRTHLPWRNRSALTSVFCAPCSMPTAIRTAAMSKHSRPFQTTG